MHSIAIGTLLLAASLFAQNPKVDPRSAAALAAMTLDETPDQVTARFGPPQQTAESGPNYQAWQYFLGADQHDPSHFFLFRKSDRKLASITRNADTEESIDSLFPPAETRTCIFRKEGKIPYTARVRKLSGDRVLVAMGAARPGQPVRQIVLIRQSALRVFLPWVEEELRAAKP